MSAKPPTTDELVEALRELRATKEALNAAERRDKVARERARDLTKRARPDFDWLGSTENGLAVAIADGVLEDRQRPAKPDNTPATFLVGDIVEYGDGGRGCVAAVEGEWVRVRYWTGRTAWRHRAELTLVHREDSELSE